MFPLFCLASQYLLFNSEYICFNIQQNNAKIWNNKPKFDINIYTYTVCPRSLDPFYSVNYYIKWVKAKSTIIKKIFTKLKSAKRYAKKIRQF